MRCSLPCGNLTINSVREYKYLGFVITPSGEITTGLFDLRSRASYALDYLNYTEVIYADDLNAFKFFPREMANELILKWKSRVKVNQIWYFRYLRS